MAINLNEEQRNYVNGTARPQIERLVAIWHELDAFVREADNQQDPIANVADILNDGTNGTTPRTDGPQLMGSHITQLRNFCANMRDQISSTALNTLITLMVRDFRTVVKES